MKKHTYSVHPSGEDLVGKAREQYTRKEYEDAVYTLRAYLANVDDPDPAAAELLTSAQAQVGASRLPTYLKLMCIPPAFHRVSLEGIDPSVRDQVSFYVGGIRDRVALPANLIIQGDAGVGKTSVAVYILIHARYMEFPGFFITVAGLRDTLRARDQETAQETLRRCRECQVLVLDDLIDLGRNDWRFNSDNLRELLVQRHHDKRLTLLTMRTPDGLEALAKNDSLRTDIASLFTDLTVTGENRHISNNETLRTSIFGK